MKRKRIINVPSEYIDVCKNAQKNPKTYAVMFLENKFFKRFDNVQFLESIRPERNSRITDIRAVKEIYFKNRFLMHGKYYRRKLIVKLML